jgi:hypothetical protein
MVPGAPAAAELRAGGAGGVGRRAVRRLSPHRWPVTALLTAVIVGLLVAGEAGLGVARVGITWPALADGEVWRIPVSALVQEDVGGWAILLLVPCLGLAEHRFGSWAALLVFFGVDALSTVPVLAALHLVGGVGGAQAARLAGEPNVGSSAGLVGALGAWVAARPPRTRWRWVLGLAGALVVGMAIDPELAGVQHAIAAVIGGAAGVALARRVPQAPAVASGHE